VITTTTRFHHPDVLRSFGLTSTEATAYRALLDTGAITGYQLARHLGLARANAYAALEGLARRGLVRRDDGPPAVFESLPPEAVLAHLAARQAEALEALESFLMSRGSPGTARMLEQVAGDRPVRAVIERLAARARERVGGSLPAAALHGFELFARGLRGRGIAVNVGAGDSDLGVILVDRAWALVWRPGGLALWGNEPLLLEVASRLVTA